MALIVRRARFAVAARRFPRCSAWELGIYLWALAAAVDAPEVVARTRGVRGRSPDSAGHPKATFFMFAFYPQFVGAGQPACMTIHGEHQFTGELAPRAALVTRFGRGLRETTAPWTAASIRAERHGAGLR
jgi:hypothetical protein